MNFKIDTASFSFVSERVDIIIILLCVQKWVVDQFYKEHVRDQQLP